MKRLLLLILIAMLAFETQAQISFGPSASLNIATQKWKGNNAANYTLSPFIGFQAGVFGNYKLGEKFAAHAEVLYSSEGTREKNSSSGSKGYINFNFLRVPILAQYYILEDLHVEAGPNIGVFLSGKEKWNGHTEKIDGGYKSIDAGLSIGAGYNLSKFAKGVTAGVRFYYGLTNIVEAENLNGGGFKNRVFSVNVRYALPFGSK